MDEYEIFEFLESDQEHNAAKLQRKALRVQSDPFGMDEKQFIEQYRLSKELVHNLCEELRPHMLTPMKSTDLTVETKVLTALSFYAMGSYQRRTGNMAAHSLAQPTVSKVISEITKCLNLPHMRAKYIKFPQNEQERRDNILKFYNKFGIPGVLGCIGCTHVAIIRPSEHEKRYYCSKQYHSLNVQLICNADMEIVSVNASYGGATHDSFIWANHPLNTHMEEISCSEDIWFLGDSGYPQSRCMMTPIINAAPESPDAHYTDVHVKARDTIDRTIGLLKARFRCLLAHRILHYEPFVAGSIVNACVILHNICIRTKLSVQELSEDEVYQEAQMQPKDSSYLHQPASTLASSAASTSDMHEGVMARQSLITQLWTF